MIVAALQLPGWGGEPADRAGLAHAAVDDAVRGGARLVVLPEAYFPGYRHTRLEGEAAARAFAAACADRHQIVVLTGFLAGRAGTTACTLGAAWPDGGWATYDKRYPSPAESRVWSAGREAVIVATPAGRLGLLVCADVLQPQSWRPFAGRVDLVVVAAAWPDYRGRRTPAALGPALSWVYRESGAHRDRLLSAAALALGAPIVFANACGPYQGRESFSGGSGIWGPDGGTLARAGAGREVLLAEVSAREVAAEAPGAWALHGQARWIALAVAWRAAVRLHR